MFIRLCFTVFSIIVLCQAVRASSPATIIISDSDSVAQQVRKLPLTVLKEVKYDLTQMSYSGRLSEKFKWTDNTAPLPNEVTKLLNNTYQLNLSAVLNAYAIAELDLMSNGRCTFLYDIACAYQEIEAEGVFYRSLKSLMDDQNDVLISDVFYQLYREANVKLVNEYFDIVERLASKTKNSCEFILRQYKRGKITQDQLFEQLLAMPHVTFPTMPNAGGIVSNARAELEALRLKFKLPQAKVKADNKNNNNN